MTSNVESNALVYKLVESCTWENTRKTTQQILTLVYK